MKTLLTNTKIFEKNTCIKTSLKARNKSIEEIASNADKITRRANITNIYNFNNNQIFKCL